MKALIFDLDGTLIDTVYAQVLAWQKSFATLEHLTVPAWCLHQKIGLDGKLSAEVLDVCSDELVHNERASNAPTLRPQVRASRRSLTGEPGVLDKSAGRQRKGQPHGPARIETARTGSTSRVTLPRVAI